LEAIKVELHVDILKTLSDINDLQARYHLARSEHNLLKSDIADGAFATGDDFVRAIVESKEKLLAKVKETQRSLSVWQKSRWVVRDEQKMSRYCQDLEGANEALRSFDGRNGKRSFDAWDRNPGEVNVDKHLHSD
jgi:hypothetical protein